jgi:nitrogen fixation NifU-like protein
MSGDIKKLYSETIRTHNESPFHFEKKELASFMLKAYNPICGDRFELYLSAREHKFSEICFHGFGCAISKASTSVLAKTMEGKSFQDALTVCNVFLDFIGRKPEVDPKFLPDEFRAFSGVHDFPERYDCATLSWREM